MMIQIARNLTDPDEPFLRRTRFLIMDRDTKYSETFRAALTREDWEIALLVNNVTNEAANLALDRERGGEARVAYLRNQPRTIGLTARRAF